MITRRGWAAVLGAIAGWGMALTTLNPLLLVAAVTMVAFVVAEVVRFHQRLAGTGPEAVSAQRREGPPSVPARSPTATAVDLVYAGGPGFRAEVVDVVPDSFRVEDGSPRRDLWFGPGASLSVGYAFTPELRGAYVMGPTVVTARDAFGFAESVAYLDTTRPVSVVPRTAFLRSANLGRTSLSYVEGANRLRRRGFGTEFRALRPYAPDDDHRSIAWKRSTLDRLLVREFEQESRQDFLVLLDVTPGMHAGRRGESALDRAVDAATLLTGLVARGGDDRIGLLTYASGVSQYFPPERGRRHAEHLLRNLALVRPHAGSFDAGPALDEVAKRLRHHTQVVCFSALQGGTAGFAPAAVRLARRGHRLYLFLPNLVAFYPPVGAGLPSELLASAGREERARFAERVETARRAAVPVFPYDRRGAEPTLLRLYGQVRAWEGAR